MSTELVGPNQFRCGNCGLVFEKGWTDEEAAAEYVVNMPNAAERGDEIHVVCDDCYTEILAWVRTEGLEL